MFWWLLRVPSLLTLTLGNNTLFLFLSVGLLDETRGDKRAKRVDMLGLKL